jgi:hypothetical protein
MSLFVGEVLVRRNVTAPSPPASISEVAAVTSAPRVFDAVGTW